MKRVLVLISAVVLSLGLSSCTTFTRGTETIPGQDESTVTEQFSVQNESVHIGEMPVEKNTENELVEQSMTDNSSKEKYTVKTRISDVFASAVLGLLRSMESIGGSV